MTAPREENVARLRRHDNIGAQSAVYVLLFHNTRAFDSETDAREAADELAYLLAGTGRWTKRTGLWMRPQRGENRPLDITHLPRTKERDPLRPYAHVYWQPLRWDDLERAALTGGTIEHPESAEVADAASRLQQLSEHHAEQAVPDGLVPTALISYLAAVGDPHAKRMAAEAVAAGAVELQAAELLYEYGQAHALAGAGYALGKKTDPDGARVNVAACDSCGAKMRRLFRIKPTTAGATSATLVDGVAQRKSEESTAALPVASREGAQRAIMNEHTREGVCAGGIFQHGRKATSPSTARYLRPPDGGSRWGWGRAEYGRKVRLVL